MTKFLSTVSKSFNNKKLIITKLKIKKIRELNYYKISKGKKDLI